MGEVAAMAQVLTHVGLLNAIQDHVQFARARFGQYDTIDFVVVLLGYAISGEPTLQSFYERLAPFSAVFMALFDRNQMGAYSAPPIILSTHKNADRSAMARSGCCMLLALVTAAIALCEHSVKQTFSRSNPGGSVPFSGRCLPTRSSPLHSYSNHLSHPHVPRCCGAIGHAATSGVTGSKWYAPKPST
jgi:hypothetical protein